MNVWTGGTFDLFHPGHVHLLAKCRDIADVGAVTVAVNTDEFVARFKAPPVQTYMERIEVVQACRHVDYVQRNDGTDQAGLIRACDAAAIVIGDDWQGRDYLGQLGITEEFLARYVINVIYIPRLPQLSSTDLKKRVRG